ncbi:hypothetical protein V6238_18360 [Marinomonas arenicola]|jgi:hypothetical protein|uniref:hypothetical protein n=1 Tax=Marinomonas arenicola TaxID=569601 RepID=UPI00311D8F02
MKTTQEALQEAIEAAEKLATALQDVNLAANKENTPQGALISLIITNKIKEAMNIKIETTLALHAYNNEI